MKKIIFLLAIPIALFCAWKAVHYLEEARISETKAVLSSLVTSLHAYHKEYGHYTDDFKKLGFSVEGSAQVYLDSEKVPEYPRGCLNHDENPFVDKDRFRALGIIQSGARVTKVTIDEVGEMRVVSCSRGSIKRGW